MSDDKTGMIVGIVIGSIFVGNFDDILVVLVVIFVIFLIKEPKPAGWDHIEDTKNKLQVQNEEEQMKAVDTQGHLAKQDIM